MILNLNIVKLITPITSWNKKYFIKNTFYYSIKLFIMSLHTKFIREELQFSKNFSVDKILSG